MAKTTDYPAQIKKLNKLSTALYATLAVAAAFLMNTTAVAETISYLVRDQIASQLAGQTVFGTAVREVADLQIKWLLIAMLGISAILSLLYATKWKKRYEDNAKSGVNPLRWLEAGIATVIMIEIIALLSGITDLGVLKVISGLVVLSALLGYLAERQNKASRKFEKSGFYLSVAAGALPWLLILITAISTYVYGMIRAPWYVYALYLIVVASYSFIAISLLRRFKGQGKWKNAAYVERNLLLNGILMKSLFAIVLVVGLQK